MIRWQSKILVALNVLAVVLHSRPAAAQISPVGDQFQVNTYTTGPQGQGIEGYFSRQLVSRAANGEFVVVWSSSFDQDGDSDGVFGQRFNASGTAAGTEFQVNTYTTYYQAHPAVAQLGGGGFVVVWESDYQDGDSRGVFGQRFNTDGSTAGTEFQVNSYTTSYQQQPSIAATADGGFVVSWRSNYQDGDSYGVFAQRFTATATPLGTEFQVNTYTTGEQAYHVAAASAAGGFVVVWESFGQDGGSGGVFGQRFDAAGALAGTEFQANVYTTGNQGLPHVDMDASGGFVVTWDDFTQTLDIFARRYASDGSALGGPFPVTSATSTAFAAVAVDDDGSFVVVFEDYQDLALEPADVVAQHFDATGAPTGPALVVNTYTSGDQLYPSVATDGDGGFVVVWVDYNDRDGDARGVFARRLGPANDGDGIPDETDNCPLVTNPDQLNSDCPDPDFLTSGGCAGSVPSDSTGCCDGGDVCDPCPAQKDNSNCDPALSVGATIGPDGGVVQTSEVNGTISATVVIPPGALTDFCQGGIDHGDPCDANADCTSNSCGGGDVSISITENGPATRFSLQKAGATADVLSTSMRPEGQRFLLPVQVTLRWDDRDMDGLVDTGLCEGGIDDGQPCDADGDCASGSCRGRSNTPEADLILKRNNNRFSQGGFGVSPFRCSDHLDGSGCEAATADCSDAAGTDQSTVAKCCDPTAGPTDTRTFGEWTFETCDFSEFLVGLDASGLVAGKGSPKTDCIFEWAPNNPINEKYLDSKGLPNFKQDCRDGDPVCDRDGAANGQCSFEVGLCLNLHDPRLIKNGQVECAASDVARWQLIRPKVGSANVTDQIIADALVGAAIALGGVADDEEVAFAAPITEPAACGQPATLVVQLGGEGTKKGKAVIKVRTETSPPPGKNRGTKDTDKLKLTCLPPK